MKNVRLLLSCFVLLLVGLLALSFPGTAAAAEVPGDFVVVDDGGTPENPTGAIDIPGILSIMIGTAGAQQPGAVTLGPIQFEVPNVNATATVSGLSFGQAGFGWDAITLAQKEPQQAGSVIISGAQASIGGPSSRYSTDITAHVATQPSETAQAEGTFAISYDGMTGQAYAGFRDFDVVVDKPAVNAQISGSTDPATGFTLNTLAIGLPNAGVATELSGFTMTPAGADWDAITVSRDAVQLAQPVKISDLQLTVMGPSAGYAAEASALVELTAGDLAYAGGQIEAMYDPSTGQINILLSDGDAWVKTNAVSIELQGIHTGESGVAIDTVLIASPPAGLEVTVDGVTIGGGAGLGFQEAHVKVTPTGGGPSKGFETTVTNSDGSYTVTTTSTFVFGGGS